MTHDAVKVKGRGKHSMGVCLSCVKTGHWFGVSGSRRHVNQAVSKHRAEKALEHARSH